MSLRTKINGIRDIWQFSNRWHLIFSRLFFSNETVQYYRLNDIEFISDHAAGDTNGAREVLTSPMYKRFLSQLALPHDIKVIDLGANNGGFPLLLKSQNLFIKELLCVELNPHTFARLCFNLDRNFGDRFTAINCAVCGSNRPVLFHPGQSSVSDNIYHETVKNGLSSRQIGRTFNDIYEEFFGDSIVDICKLDIEGAEFELFRDANASKISRCKYVIIEIHHSAKTPRELVLKEFRDAGFDEINGEKKIGDRHYVHLFASSTLLNEDTTL
ncbi:MAG: FkbM family methyltransferase [Pyrinomonadaceae bacterium]